MGLHDAVADLAVTLADRGKELSGAAWNDTTYLQPAQPSSFGYYLAGFAEQALRDLERIRSCYGRLNHSPAGSGGVGGTTVPLDRERLAASLGFDGPTPHIRDGMWSADALIDASVAAVQATLTLDRLAEDTEIFASPQFGYVRLAGSSSRASVLLPQKRNPYALAVIRGGAGTLIGKATGVMATQRTPSARTDNWLYAYGEVVSAVETATRLIRLGQQVVQDMEVDVEALARSAGEHHSMATDLAESLVLGSGLDYRSAYRVVGRAVAEADETDGHWPTEQDLERAARELGIVIESFGGARTEAGTPGEVLALRESPGSAAPHWVVEHCDSVRTRAKRAMEWSSETSAKNDVALDRILAEASAISEGR